ncbi:unnamed protein product, partial [Rotaria sp. Silwood2]
PYNNSFVINDQGQVFNLEILNQSSYYHLHIMAIDDGKPNRLNSTHHCYISIATMNIFDNLIEYENISLLNISLNNNNNNKNIQWPLSIFDHYSYLVIGVFTLFLFIFIIIITICITLCLYTVIFGYRKNRKQKKTYHCSKQYNLY